MIALAGATAHAVLSVNQAASELSLANEAAASLTRWEALLTSNILPVGSNGDYASPLGVYSVEHEYHTLPSWIAADKQGPYGKPLVYCPYSLSSSSSMPADDSVNLTKDDTYDVDITSNTLTFGHDYVTGSDSHPSIANLLAILILPTSNTNVPTCSDVVYDGTRFKVANGLVRVITSQSKIADSTANPINSISYNISESNSSSNFTSINSSWNTSQPEITTFLFDSGADHTTADINFVATYLPKTIILKGSPGSTLSASSGTKTISFKNINLFIEGLDIAADVLIKLENSSLTTSDTFIHNLEIVDGSWTNISPSTVIGSSATSEAVKLVNSDLTNHSDLDIDVAASSGYGIVQQGGESRLMSGSVLTIDGSVLTAGFQVERNAALYLDGATVNVTSTSSPNIAINIFEGARLESYSGTFNFSDTPSVGIDSSGVTILDATSLLVPDGASIGIELGNGGSLSMSNSTTLGDTTNMPQTGVNDLGAIAVTGTNATINYSSLCKTGLVFGSVVDKSTWSCQ